MESARVNIKRIVVGLDGSTQSAAALEWAIGFARAFSAEVVAVHAIPFLAYAVDFYGMAPPIQYDPEWAAEMKRQFEQEWCKPLRDSGLPYRTVLKNTRPASLIAETAESVDADLVVVGRRGLGGVAEVLLGSVSHELSLHCKRPVLLISQLPTAPTRARAGVIGSRKPQKSEAVDAHAG
jgi:nucleotide-binding universal stress UspA family protein